MRWSHTGVIQENYVSLDQQSLTLNSMSITSQSAAPPPTPPCAKADGVTQSRTVKYENEES